MKKKKPDFLVIGAQRAGTTWLHSNLSKHLNVWLPRIKEIHYFDRIYSVKFNDKLVQVQTQKSVILRRIERATIRKILNPISSLNLADLRWEFTYHFGKMSNDWYESLFWQAGNRVTGDITPAYSILDHASVTRIYEYLPNLKIIFILRNPVERAWSNAVKDFSKLHGKDIAQVNISDLISHFNSAGSLLRGDYLRTIKIWGSIFPKSQMIVCFFDDIVGRPIELLNHFCDFLGICHIDKKTEKSINQIINPSKPSIIPPNMRKYLTRLYYDQICKLSDQFSSHAYSWKEDADRVLNCSQTSGI